MNHPAGFPTSAIPVSPGHAGRAELLRDPATGHCPPDEGACVPDPSAARTRPWTPPPAHLRVLFAAAARPGEV
jgi:hypothetical protein